MLTDAEYYPSTGFEGEQAWNWNISVMATSPAAPRLSPAGQRVLASFLAGRLPAGQLNAELLRTEGRALGPPPLPGDTASPPLPPPAAPVAVAVRVA